MHCTRALFFEPSVVQPHLPPTVYKAQLFVPQLFGKKSSKHHQRNNPPKFQSTIRNSKTQYRFVYLFFLSGRPCFLLCRELRSENTHAGCFLVGIYFFLPAALVFPFARPPRRRCGLPPGHRKQAGGVFPVGGAGNTGNTQNP